MPKTKDQPAGGKIEPPADKLILRLDVLTFSRVQMSDSVILRVLCRENGAMVNFTLKNMNISGEGRGTVLDLTLDLDRFVDMLNPKLKVIFQSENVVAPFVAAGLSRGNAFSSMQPMTDMVN